MSIKQLSREEFRREYLKSLNQDIQNINKNLEANRFFIQTGEPSRPTDVRTITEKTADIEGLKALLRAELKKITDSTNAGLIIQGLGDDELKFLYTQFSGIEREIAPRFKTGVPADIFIQFLRKYIERFEATGGVEAPLAEQLETALEPVIEELATERSERTPASEKTGEYTPQYTGKIPDDENWSNFSTDDEVMNSWKKMKIEVKRQKRLSRLSAKQKKDREDLLKSMDTIKLQGSSGVNSAKRLAVKIREWSSSNPDDFDYLKNILQGVVGAGVKMVVIDKHKISGKGLATPTMPKKNRQKLGFCPFGKYIIDVIGLDDDVISIRSSSKAPIPSIPRQRVSKRVSSVLKTIAGGGMPSYEDIGELKNDEKKFLNKVLKTARLSDKIKVPNPDKSKEDAEMERFNILKGQIIAGNDSSELIKEFKGLLVKYKKEGRLPSREVNEILSELLLIGL